MVTGKVIAVDFDGTITRENKFPEIGKVNEDAVRVLRKLIDNGNSVFLYTCRQAKELVKAFEVLREHGLPLSTYSPYDYTLAAGRKPIADFYIDDRAFASYGMEMDWKRIEEVLC